MVTEVSLGRFESQGQFKGIGVFEGVWVERVVVGRIVLNRRRKLTSPPLPTPIHTIPTLTC